MRRLLAITGALALLALIVPASVLAAPVQVTVGGPTAEAWVTSGAGQGFVVGLTATPANETPWSYDGLGPDPIFDATDRDTIGPPGGPFGLGVDNGWLSNGMPGVTSYPSEIGYYGNAAICGTGMVLADNCADKLAVTLDKPLYGGSFEVTFLYGPEQTGETLRVVLIRDGIEQYDHVYGPVNNGAYPGTAGIADFVLPDVYWNEIQFIGNDAAVADATDFLVEFVSGLVRPELGGDSATGIGATIMPKGTWFMYNTYPDGDNCWDIQAGKGGPVIGHYCIQAISSGQFIATYDIDDTITFGDWEYDIVVLQEHLAISQNAFTSANPGLLDNEDFGVPFPATSPFNVFAHFSIDYV